MRLLVIGLDSSLTDAASPAAERQKKYYEGIQADIILLQKGDKKHITLHDSVRVHVPGGQTWLGVLWRATSYVRRVHAQRPFDVMTIQEPVKSALVAFGAHLSIPIQLQDHAAFFTRPQRTVVDVIKRIIASFVVKRVSRIRTVSLRGKRGLESLGIPAERIDVAPVPLSVERFRGLVVHPSDHPRMLCIARLHEEKGIDILLRAFALVREKHPTAQLTIAGEGKERKALESLTAQLGLAARDAVHFLGHQTDVAALFQAADIYVQPSRSEGWGMAVIEAAAAGLPIVMTDTGCAGECIQNEISGLVVPPGEVRALADALSRLIEDPGLSARLAQQARVMAEQLPSYEEGIKKIQQSLERTAETSIKSSEPRIGSLSSSAKGLLVIAQAVDVDDPLFGFFHAWLREMSQRFPSMTVLALRVGHYDLPASVRVIPLRRASSHSQIEAVSNLLRCAWRYRHQYDAVFIRGDAQYLVIAGWLWRVLRKRTVFWYAHYRARGLWFWLATPWVHTHVTSIREAHPLSSALSVGQSIDTNAFIRTESSARSVPRILVFGRVSEVKRVPWIVEAISSFVAERVCSAQIVGRALTDSSRAELHAALRGTSIEWEDRDVKPKDAPALYHSADIFINATPGSLDKTILEPAASGLIVLATSPAYRRNLPVDLQWLGITTQEEMKLALQRVLDLSLEERLEIGRRLRVWVEENHSLKRQIALLYPLLSSKNPRPSLRIFLKRFLQWVCSFFSSAPEGVSVLMFHAFDGKGSASWDPNRFSELIQRLKNQGWMFHRLADLWNQEQGWQIPSQGKHILLTIDDATEDVEQILPVLQLLRVPAVIAAPSDVSTLKTSDGWERRVLSEEALRRLVESGWIEMAGHGVTHEHLTEMDQAMLERELSASKAFVERLNVPGTPAVLVYPRGRVDARVIQCAIQKGFVAGCMVEPGPWKKTTDLFFIPRYPVLSSHRPLDVIRRLSSFIK